MVKPPAKNALEALAESLGIPSLRFSKMLRPGGRCPHCSVPDPGLNQYWVSNGPVPRGNPGPVHKWGVYVCTSCGGAILAKGSAGDAADNAGIIEMFPAAKSVHEDIPQPARRFLEQAIATLHAPDAAAVMAGAAVDAMLKKLGYERGSVYARIDEAVVAHKLTSSMGAWAHEVRLGSNRPRHADSERPHVEAAEAEQAVEFAEALAYFLFVLTERIERGKKAATEASLSPPLAIDHQDGGATRNTPHGSQVSSIVEIVAQIRNEGPQR